MKKLLFVFLLLSLLFVVPAYAIDTKLSWDKVTLASDGTPIQELTGYKVYVSQTAGAYGASIATVTPSAAPSITETYTYAQSTKGIYFVVVTAFNSAGESGKSNEVTFTVKPGIPGAPKNLKLIIPVQNTK